MQAHGAQDHDRAQQGYARPHLHVKEARACVRPADGEGVSVVGVLQHDNSAVIETGARSIWMILVCLLRQMAGHMGEWRESRHRSSTCSASRYMVCPKMGRLLRQNLLLSPCRRSCFSRCTATCMRGLAVATVGVGSGDRRLHRVMVPGVLASVAGVLIHTS